MENRNSAVPANEAALFANVLKVVITVMFVFPLVHYTIYKEVQHPQETTEVPNVVSEIINTTMVEDKIIKKIRKPIIKQPTCPIHYQQVIFNELCNELFIKRETCTPEDINNEDKHKIPRIVAKNKSGHEPRGTIIGYLAGGLLMTSLGAAIVELYKAKSQTPAKNKPPLNRKCSLADLTVLKHNRRELARRDSILEVPEDGNASKQLGFRPPPPPLHRRCSFPVGPSEFNYGLQYGMNMGIRDSSRKNSFESRRPSIVDASRRPSVDCRSPLIDGGRRISIGNDSPERTRHHWSRLLHRH